MSKQSKPFQFVIDSLPKVDQPLSAKYVQSFAYPTFKERAPKILQGVIEDLNQKERIRKDFGDEAANETSILIREIEKFKNNIQSDHPLIEITTNGKHFEEAAAYNKQLREKQIENSGNPPSWFQTDWLFAECYMYYKLFELFQFSKHLKEYDPFLCVKVETLKASESAVLNLSEYLSKLKANNALNEEERKTALGFLIKCTLWGNKADLSLSCGKAVAASSDIQAEIEKFNKNILVDDLEAVIDLFADSKNTTIDIVLDNAGYELFNDLCFADFLIWSGLIKKVIFHGKLIPWFVSDVTERDFSIILDVLENKIKSEHTTQLIQNWRQYLKTGQWETQFEPFWILPYDFSKMQSVAPDLYSKLQKNKLVIFKGDLNYRKLVGDIYWEPTTSFEKALRGFGPTNVLALRTVKADTIAGLRKGLFEQLTEKDPKWLTTGEYALIQLLRKN